MTIAIDIRSLSGGAYTGVGEYTRNLLKHMTPLVPDIQFKLFFNAHSPFDFAQGKQSDLEFLKEASNVKPYFFVTPINISVHERVF